MEEKYDFIDTESRILNNINNTGEVIIIGDINDRVDREKEHKVVVKHGKNTRKDNDKILIIIFFNEYK